MKSKTVKPGREFVVRLETGDEVLSKIAEFCKTNNIQGGTLSGIGGLKYAKIYSVQSNEEFITTEEVIEKPIELISALGNISRKENGEPLVHIHVCLGLPDHSAKTGHLLEGKISWTGEFFIHETEMITKKKNGKLFLMDL